MLARFRDAFGDILSAFEYMDVASVAIAHEFAPQLFSRSPICYMLLECLLMLRQCVPEIPASMFPDCVLHGSLGNKDSTELPEGLHGPFYAVIELSTGYGTDGISF